MTVLHRLKSVFVAICLGAVPATWRDDVRRDLAEEAGARAFWQCRQALAIGARMRWMKWMGRTAGRPAATASSADMLGHDLRFAWRTLGRQPAWTIVAVATLALGIGANTAVFSVVRSTLVNPLPFRDADRLVIPWLNDKKASIAFSPSVATIETWRAESKSLEGVELYRTQDVTMTGYGDPVVLHAASISDTFDEFAGVPFVIGRGFTKDETARGAAQVIVLGERAWHSRFGADRSMVGRAITLDGAAHMVVGVISDAVRFPAQFQNQSRRDVFMPFINETARFDGSAIARLRADVTVEDAQRELDTLLTHVPANSKLPGSFKTWLSRPGASGEFRQSLLMLAWAVAIVLLIACLNVAHLLLARGLTRERELAIRTALGAGRGRLMRQLITESMVLALAGGTAGVLLGGWLLRGLTALRPARLEMLGFATLDAAVVGAAALTTVVAGVSFGMISAWRADRAALADTLRATSTGITHNRSRQRLRSMLIVGEVAMAAVLLVGATLLVRSVANLQRIDPGFDARDLYSLRLTLPPERCSPRAPKMSVEFCRDYAQRWLDRVRAVPGIADATLAGTAPPHDSGFLLAQWATETRPAASDAPRTITAANYVRLNYFSVLRLPITDGRAVNDASEAQHEVVINQGFAAELWPGERAVGKKFRDGSAGGPDRPWLTVVGVVGDASVQDLKHDPSDRVVYFGSVSGGYSLIARAERGFDPSAAMRAIALEMNPNLALPTVTSVAGAFDAASIASSRFTMTLLTIFAAVAVLLCAVGLYGVIAYLVSQRTREIGIRLALGGSRAHIARLVLSRALLLTVAGLAIGLAASRFAASAASTLLYGVQAFDPLAYAAGSLLLLMVAAAACIAPMTRAMRVDPLTATREP